MAATAPGSRRQRLILTTRHPSWQRRSWVERPEDCIHDDIAAAGNALFDESEVDGAHFIEAACNGALGRPQTAQLSAKHNQP